MITLLADGAEAVDARRPCRRNRPSCIPRRYRTCISCHWHLHLVEWRACAPQRSLSAGTRIWGLPLFVGDSAVAKTATVDIEGRLARFPFGCRLLHELSWTRHRS